MCVRARDARVTQKVSGSRNLSFGYVHSGATFRLNATVAIRRPRQAQKKKVIRSFLRNPFPNSQAGEREIPQITHTRGPKYPCHGDAGPGRKLPTWYIIASVGFPIASVNGSGGLTEGVFSGVCLFYHERKLLSVAVSCRVRKSTNKSEIQPSPSVLDNDSYLLPHQVDGE